MSKLPVALTPEAITAWVADLETASVKARAGHLYAALQALRAKALPETTRLALLEIIRPSVFAVSEILAREATCLAVPLPEAARNVAKLSALLHHELALGYERALGDAAVPAAQRVMASLGWMLVRIVQLGEPLGTSVWKRLYTLYQQGEAQGWLTQSANEPLRGNEAETPQDRFKCAAAFAALAPARFDPRILGEMFDFLLRHRRHIALSDTGAGGWVVALSQGLGPCRAELAPKIPGRLLFLNIHLPQADELSLSLARGMHHLLGLLPREQYPLARRVDELWRGWESIATELGRRTSANTWLAVPEFELAPLDDESAPGPSNRIYRRLDGWLRLHQDEPIAVLEVESVTAQPGDLLGLKLLDETLLAAVVRWVKPAVPEHRTCIGLDLLGSGLKRVQAFVGGQRPLGIVAARGETSVLMLEPLKLKPGTQVMLGGEEAKILRLLEWTQEFCAYGLSFGYDN